VRLGAVCLLPPPRRGGMVNPVGLAPRVGRDGATGGAPPRFGLFFLGGGPGMAAGVVDCLIVGDR
jgi:hypothetical protein